MRTASGLLLAIAIAAGGIDVAMGDEPAKHEMTSRFHASVTNPGKDDLRIERFYVMKERWALGTDKPTLAWWDSLTFKSHLTRLEPGQSVELSSKTYSSQRENGRGHVPFWCLRAGRRYLFFSLAWCGGWRAEIVQDDTSTGVEIVFRKVSRR